MLRVSTSPAARMAADGDGVPPRRAQRADDANESTLLTEDSFLSKSGPNGD